MPYIAGGTLESMLKASPRPMGMGAVWRCLEQICLALDYAHTRNVAHLDLKPGNLLVHEDGRLLLADFGLAHMMEQGSVEGSTSLQFGTPAYMSPEHLQGRPERRSDIYSLGIMLYLMLTGRVPFEGSTPAIVIVKHLNEAPPSLRAVRPDLPAQLEDVLSKALAKDPNARYQTASELLAGFKEAVSGPTIPAIGSPISGVPTSTRLDQIYFDPTVRAQKPPGVPGDVYQELAELKEAVRKLTEPKAPSAAAAPAEKNPEQEAATIEEKQPPKEAVKPAAQSPAKSTPAQKSGVSWWAIGSLILALAALAIAISYIVAGFEEIYSFWELASGSLLSMVPGVPALLTGHTARRQILQSKGKLTGLHAAESAIVVAWLTPGVWAYAFLSKLLRLLGTFIDKTFFKEKKPPA